MTIMRRLAAAALLVALAPVPVFATELRSHKSPPQKRTVWPQGFIEDAGSDRRLTSVGDKAEYTGRDFWNDADMAAETNIDEGQPSTASKIRQGDD